jgi:hypothetical protein
MHHLKPDTPIQREICKTHDGWQQNPGVKLHLVNANQDPWGFPETDRLLL